MSAENFERFAALVLGDLALQEKVRDIDNKKVFVARMVELGGDEGFEFTAEHVVEALDEKKRAWIQRWI
jgi:hypothetical protein